MIKNHFKSIFGFTETIFLKTIMNKEVENILSNTEFKYEWCNMGHWQHHDYTTLLEAVEHHKIQISYRSGNCFVKYSYGNYKHYVKTSLPQLQFLLITLLKEYYEYLNDKAIITVSTLTRRNLTFKIKY